jgi:hypothetical protein
MKQIVQHKVESTDPYIVAWSDTYWKSIQEALEYFPNESYRIVWVAE